VTSRPTNRAQNRVTGTRLRAQQGHGRSDQIKRSARIQDRRRPRGRSLHLTVRFRPAHKYARSRRPQFGMSRKPASSPTKVESVHRARGGRQDIGSVRCRAAQSTNASACRTCATLRSARPAGRPDLGDQGRTARRGGAPARPGHVRTSQPTARARSRLSRRVRHAPPGSVGQRDYRVDRTRGGAC
jgi:hypothetical protein